MAESPERAFGMQLKGREVFPAVPPFFCSSLSASQKDKALPRDGRLPSPLLTPKGPAPVGEGQFRGFGFEARRGFFAKALPSGSHPPALASGKIPGKFLCYFSRLKRLYMFLIIPHPEERHSLLRRCGPLRRFQHRIRKSFRRRCDRCKEPFWRCQ